MTKRTLINTAHCILCCLTIFAGASAGAATLGGPMTLEDEGSFFVNGKIVDSDFPGSVAGDRPVAAGPHHGEPDVCALPYSRQ